MNADTASTRSAGMFFHWLTACVETPTARARGAMPPAAEIALSTPFMPRIVSAASSLSSDSYSSYTYGMIYHLSVDLADRIRYARRAASLTQQQLASACDSVVQGEADRSGISREAVSQWENRNTIPGLERVEQIATATGVSFAWLATGQGPMQEEEGGPVFSKKALQVAEKFDRLPPAAQTAIEALISQMAPKQEPPAPQRPPKPEKPS